MIAYKDIVPIGQGLILAATGFGLGAIYGNWPYDIQTLFYYDPSGKAFEQSLEHYLRWANAPPFIHYTLHGVFILGLIGCFIKLYKPDPDAIYFEYGTLGLLVLAFIVYLTNLRTGLNSCFYDQWGEVDMPTGINVMAASQFMIILVLVGVFVLQGGLYYATWYDNKIKAEFLEAEAKRQQTAAAAATAGAPETTKAPKAAAAKKTAAPKAVAEDAIPTATATKATGASKTKSTPKKTTKKTK